MADLLETATDAITGVAEARTGLKVAESIGPIIMWAAIGLVVLLGLNTVFGFISDPFGLKKGQVVHAQAQAAQAKGDATVAGGQSAAAADAAKIIDIGRTRADVTVHVQQENRSALLADPGAGQVIDPGLAADLSSRLCRYATYADDPGCAQVRAPDPGQLPQAGAGNAAPQPSGAADGR